MGNLISKKELLELYGISYGALYRWKRKGLIPEDWFIKKATVTGQETFLPKELICERVELIMKQKTDVSLDELSVQLSEDGGNTSALIIETTYGKRTFYLKDIKSAVIDIGGAQRDLTGIIKGGNGE